VRQKLPHIKLVVVGYNPKYFKRTLERFIESERENIHFLGFVEDDILTALLASTDAFIFPSLYEGFGFPILEAMTNGAPVITSKVTSIPEIAGDAAMYIDPSDVNSIAEAIIKVCTNKNLQDDLRTNGRIQAKKYRWENTAERTLQIYEEAKNLSWNEQQ
jgi:glycosyltransferase involved in cell wall biosynthesis